MIPFSNRADVDGWVGVVGVDYSIGCTVDIRRRGQEVSEVSYITISDGSSVFSGNFLRLEHPQLVICTYHTYWWPVTHT